MKVESPKRTGPASGPIKVRSTSDGLHLADSILWFDSHGSGDLSFLSSANLSSSKTQVPQVIATEETLRLLETSQKRPNALVCQYNRPFSIGRLKMELLPSGTILGGASLYVETEKGRLLYAPSLQPQRTGTVRQMQLKRANSLILGAFHPDPLAEMPSRRKERERLVEAVKSLINERKYPIIFAKAVGTAQEVTKTLADAGIAISVHRTIHKINRVYDACGSSLGAYSCFSKRSDVRQRVLIFPTPSRPGRLRAPFPDLPTIVVEDSSTNQTNAASSWPNLVDRFFLSSSCDGLELREVISAVNPKEVYFFGPYAKRYVEELKGLAAKVKPLFANDQPTLF